MKEAPAVERSPTRMDWKSDIEHPTVRVAPAAPPANVSQTVMAYAEPVIELLGPNRNASQLQQALVFAKTVWNAIVRGGSELAEARGLVADSPKMLEVFDILADRKLRAFGEHHWLIDGVEVIPKEKGLAIQVKVVVPG